MRILLDECLDEGLRRHFHDHACQTCRYAGFTGLANGDLLAAADQAGFDVLITVDRNMPHQQSLRGRSVALLVIRSRTTNLEDLLVLLPDVLAALEAVKPGEVVQVGAG
jgi:predicted nuclease of predicted toxin-antitoxin system